MFMSLDKSSSFRVRRANKHFKSNSAYNAPFFLRPFLSQKNRVGRKTAIRLLNLELIKSKNTEEGSRKQWDRFKFFARMIQDPKDMRRNYLVIRKALAKVRLPKNAHIASIGCGVGSQELLLAEENPLMKITGIDLAEKLIKQAKKIQTKEFLGTEERVSFKTGSFLKNDLPKQSFDALISVDAFHWERNWGKALENMKSMINPKSKSRLLVLTYRPQGTHRMDQESVNYVLQNMQPHTVIQKLKELGFEIKEAKPIMDKDNMAKNKPRPIFSIIAQLKI